MKLKSNESDPVPFSLKRDKYLSGTNDYISIYDLSEESIPYRDSNKKIHSIDLGKNGYAPIKDVVDFIASNDESTKLPLKDGTVIDFIPTSYISIPVNRENVLKAGIVKAEDADLIVDSININLEGLGSISKVDMMLLDLLANFDWKRPLYFTQPYILGSLGLQEYLQFDGFAYRLVPIRTPSDGSSVLGRVDVDYAAPLLLDKFKYGNLKDKRVYVDNFTQYTLGASNSREAFVKVALTALNEGRTELAVELLDKGLEVLPTSQIRYTYSNTMSYVECYYMAGEKDKADALLKEFLHNTIEYIKYYMQFTGEQFTLIEPLLYNRFDELDAMQQIAEFGQSDQIINLITTEREKLINQYYENQQ